MQRAVEVAEPRVTHVEQSACTLSGFDEWVRRSQACKIIAIRCKICEVAARVERHGKGEDTKDTSKAHKHRLLNAKVAILVRRFSRDIHCGFNDASIIHNVLNVDSCKLEVYSLC